MKFPLLLTLLVLATSSAARGNWMKYKKVLRMLKENPHLAEEWERTQSERNSTMSSKRSATVTCEPYSSASTPTSVHRLTPGDIQVVGAMGDSITAALGADSWSIFTILIEYRGNSFSIGGLDSYPNSITLPNILKQYNMDLTGFSTGTGGRSSSNARLNVAYSGDTAGKMAKQARMLARRAKNDDGIDFENDWKLISIFIGGNDLCDVCNNQDRYSAENYVNNIKKALDILHHRMPRTLVNVISIMDVVPITMMQSSLICSFVHSVVCDCAKDNPDLLTEMAMAYSSGVEQLIASGRYDTREDFTVVFQPFMRDSDLPLNDNGSPDTSYFAPDCFHFSTKGHEAIAAMYWNALFEEVGAKRTDATIGEDIQCPSQGAFIATNMN